MAANSFKRSTTNECNKSNMRQFEESPERPRKRSRRSESPSEDFTDRWCFAAAYSRLGDIAGSFYSMDSTRTSTPSSVNADAEKKMSRKRKSEETLDSPSKRSKANQSFPEDLSQQTTTECSSSAGSKEKMSRKRKSEETPDSPSKRSKASQSFPEDLSQQTITECSSSAGSKEKMSRKRKSEETLDSPSKRSKAGQSFPEDLSQQMNPVSSSSAGATWSSSELLSEKDFMAKYTKKKKLGQGSYGKVFAGYRKEDNLPVAIKYVTNIAITTGFVGGVYRTIPMEVALLQHLKPAKGETSAVVRLLDWCLLSDKLILVLERPDPCMDLLKYLKTKKWSMQEDEVKILAKQLLEGVIYIHSKGVFHRDIKLENILIETGSPVPRSRIIDLDSGTFVTKEWSDEYVGTFNYMTPEYFTRGWYTPKASSAWQIGVVLFETLHEGVSPFTTESEICHKEPAIKDNLSSDCKDFLRRILNKTPEDRATMENLLHHPWLTTQDSS